MTGPAAARPSNRGRPGHRPSGPSGQPRTSTCPAERGLVGPTELEAAYADWAGRCFGLAMVVTANRELAEDAVQEAFCGWWRERDRFDASRSSLGSWLIMLTHRRAVDAVRRERRHKTATSAHAFDRALLRPDELAADVQVELAGRHVGVRRAMSALTPVQRQVLTLAYFGGHTQSQIAALLGIPLGTVKTRSFSALNRLRVELDGQERGGPGSPGSD
jgi:RNA polymerase sigma factor (sigma-70 family)